MWFAFSLVGLAVILAWQLRNLWLKPWTGMPTLSDVYRRHVMNKDRLMALDIAFRVSPEFRFELKRESWVDRFFKWVGVSVEEQFGEHRFDRLVYVASNDRHFINRVADTPELRRAAVALFQASSGRCVVRRVLCAHGWLVAQIRCRGLQRKHDSAHLERCALLAQPFLDAMAMRLRAVQPALDPGPQRRDPYLFRSILLLAISTGLSIHGLVFLLGRQLFDGPAFTIDSWRIVELSVLCGGVLVALLVGANFLLLGRSARGHLVLLELLLIGSFGAVTSSAAELREANIEWDTTAPVRIEAPVTGKSTESRRGASKAYYMHVQDWLDHKATRRIKVSPDFYASVHRGERLVIEQHPGRFGARWARVIGAIPAVQPPTR